MRPITIREAGQMFLKEWKIFSVAAGVSFLCAGAVYFADKSYVASATIVVNDPQNSPLMALSQGVSGIGKALQDGKKGNTVLVKHVEYLKSQDFYVQYFKSRDLYNHDEILEKAEGLRSSTQVSLDNDFVIRFLVRDKDQGRANELVNEVAEFARTSLLQRENSEIGDLKRGLVKQIEQAYSAYNKYLTSADVKGKSSQGASIQRNSSKINDYITDLSIRINELEIQIKENSRVISYLRSISAGKSQGPYGISQKIRDLTVENNVLQMKLKTQVGALKKLRAESQSLLKNAVFVEEMKKKAEIEFSRYEELSKALAKVELQALASESRFQVLSRSQLAAVKPKLGFFSIFGLFLILSQIISSLIVYLKILMRGAGALSNETQFARLHLKEGVLNDPRFYLDSAGRIVFKVDTKVKREIADGGKGVSLERRKGLEADTKVVVTSERGTH